MTENNMEMHQSRREFIRSAGLATAALATGAPHLRADDEDKPTPPPKYKFKIGVQMSSWAGFYDRSNKDIKNQTDEVISAARDCGYEYLEGSLDLEHPETCAEFAQKTKAKGMPPISIYMTGIFHESGTSVSNVNRYLEAARVAYDAGYTLLNCSTKGLEKDKKPAELATQVTALRRFGDELAKFGMRLAIHNNLSDTRRGGWDYQYNLRQSTGKSFGLCFDVAMLHRGGIQPTDVLKDFSSRISSWYLRQSREGVWLEDLSKGDIDYPAVMAFAVKYRLGPLYTVALELDKGTKVTRTAVENHKRSREYLKSLLEN